jgi:predicted RNase H-like HicB family nuclease
MMESHYSMLIQWSEHDQLFIVSLPGIRSYSKSHGATYEDAAQNGREVLETLIESYQAAGQFLPEPALPHRCNGDYLCLGPTE